MEALHISCNMGTRDLPDMYALSPRASGHTYQANPECPCYNLYVIHVILPNGHCDFFADDPNYETTIVAFTSNSLNKIVQVILFVVYFFYYYKYTQLLKLFQNAATGNDREQHQHFFKIAITIGVTIGFSGSIYAYNRFFETILSLAILATLLLIIQQCVIIVLMALSRKIQKLCKERFCTT